MADTAPAQQALPAGEEDLQQRIEGFNKELIPLLGKYELGLGAQPMISPEGLTVARPIMFSDRKHPAKDAVAPTAPATDAGLTKPE